MIKKELPHEDVFDLTRSISQPVFNYIIKRFSKQLKDHSGIKLNEMISIFLGAMAVTDANLLRWLKSLGVTESGNQLSIFILKDFLNKHLSDQIEEKLH